MKKAVTCSTTYEVEIFGEIYVEAEAEIERCDYGVARSPVWWELDLSSIDIVTVSIGECTWSKKELVRDFGKEYAMFIMDNLIELLPDDLDYWDME